MIDHNTRICVSCHKPLAETDDIVVCPECGAPYHRACYQAAGQCLLSARHGLGFEYEDPEARRRRESQIECPVCHTKNPEDALFCERCGQPMRPGVAPTRPDPSPQYANGEAGGAGADSETQYVAPNVMTQLHLAREYDGVATKDWMTYIGNSAPYYLYQFQRMNESSRKTSFCWSALFFPEFYFFYRKLWGWGALTLGVSLLVSVPSFLSMAAALGVPLSFSVTGRAFSVLVGLCGFINWGTRIAACLFGFYLFRQSAGRRLRAMREESPDEDRYRQALTRAGGPSYIAVILVAALLIACSVAFYLWVGPDQILNALYFY